MHTIQQFMAGDHRRCDDIFVAVEQAIHAKAWERAGAALASFQHAMLQHFEAEETLLFPAFEEQTGMTQGPTAVMRGEHEQMRELLVAAGDALAARDADAYSGEAETLLIMMQQHNMKEENMLYPMCDQHLVGQAHALMARMQDKIGA
ncbi:hemerythrin domain-containing protein [Rhodoferax sp.]|uniref:hemerythrin domain-containing protein n=1 Tax=Rhodoferax sp. TaxID=50421 RepID=UPI0027576B62|nr:hemerythrin domain-containing protein [Rhodoferax sp.]